MTKQKQTKNKRTFPYLIYIYLARFVVDFGLNVAEEGLVVVGAAAASDLDVEKMKIDEKIV